MKDLLFKDIEPGDFLLEIGRKENYVGIASGLTTPTGKVGFVGSDENKWSANKNIVLVITKQEAFQYLQQSDYNEDSFETFEELKRIQNKIKGI